MQESTRRYLEDLATIEWFHSVGQREGSTATVLASWSEALTQCQSQEWDDRQLDASNALSTYLVVHARERYQQWNAIVHDVKSFIEPLIQAKTHSICETIHPPQGFIDSIRFDLVGFAIEMEYADLCPPSFYTEVYKWYKKGHFPCGYCGQYPEGKFIIY